MADRSSEIKELEKQKSDLQGAVKDLKFKKQGSFTDTGAVVAPKAGKKAFLPTQGV